MYSEIKKCLLLKWIRCSFRSLKKMLDYLLFNGEYLVISIVNLVLCIGLIAVTISLYLSLQQANERIAQASSEIIQLKKLNEKSSQELSTANTKIQALQANDLEIVRYVEYLQYEHVNEEKIVTDDLYVTKILFGNDKNKPLTVFIDVSNQPAIAMKYRGSGKYNLSDREVRAMYASIIEATKSNYMKWPGEHMDKWGDDATVTAFINNYEIGTYKAGKFKFKGEA